MSRKPGDAQRPAAASSGVWYRKGIRFGCTECGACCRREGYVWVSAPEVERLARHLGLPVSEFRARYTMEVEIEGLKEPGVSLIRGAEACIFLDVATNRCTVYEARPAQCAAYPFWPRAVRSREDWARDVEAYCEKEALTEGRLYTAAEIQSIVSRFSVAGGKPKPPRGDRGDRGG